MRDYIVRAITADGFVKAAAICSTGLVEQARQMHQTTPTATAALGRVLSAASLIGNTQKVPNGSVTLQFRGGGPLGTVMAVSDAEGNVRGYVQNPHITLLEKYKGKLDVGAAVGKTGTLTVIRDLQMKAPYTGTIPLVSGEIAEDITAYFATSEQIPTACALGVLIDRDQSVKVAGGYLIQLLPGAPEDVIGRIEAGIKALGAVTPAMEGGMTPQKLLSAVLADFTVEFLEEDPVCYRCYCSAERVRTALISLGREELRSIEEEGEPMEVTCQFCDKVYRFSPQEIGALRRSLEEKK